MLAERKKKVKWTLNPRGNSWSKDGRTPKYWQHVYLLLCLACNLDTNKFGQRMLEKMGWKSGEGLGVNKQGITEHIKVAYKNDNKCLGYKGNGEEWVEHQSQFESLLAELSSSHSTLDSVKGNISQNETLEQRSRHSRTRVHYHKFTRGKDLSKYSEKDLKCIILGKQKANSAGEESEDNGGNECFNGLYGVKTINSGNMNDYFKKLTNSQKYSDTCSSAVQCGEVEMSEKNNDVGEQCDVKVKKKKKKKAEYTNSLALGEVEMIEKNNDVGEECDVKVKKKKKRKEVELCDTENSNMDYNEASAVKQHENKRKKCKVLEHSDSANDHPYTNYKNGSVSETKLQRQDITDHEGILINGICNEELHCGEVCKEKTLKKWKNCGIQDRESELMEVNDKIEDKQVKAKSKKKNAVLVNEGNGTSFVPEDVLSISENSKSIVEHLTFEGGSEREVRQAKKKSKKKKPVCSSEEETSLVPVKSVLHDSKNAEDTRLHVTTELDEVEGKQKRKKCKKKKQEFTGDCGDTLVTTAENISHKLENSKDTEDHLSVEGKQLKKNSKKKKDNLLSESREISLVPAEDVSYRLENSKDTDTKQHLAVEVADEIEGQQLKKKSKKKKDNLLSESREIPLVPAEDVSYRLENSKDTEQHLAVEVAEEIEGQQLKKKSKKKKHMLLSESGGASVVPIEDISQMFEISENIAEDLTGKDEGTRGVHIFSENNHIADFNRVDNGASSNNEVRSDEQTAEDVMPAKRKKKKNTKIDIENSAVEDIPECVNGISVEKRKHKRKKDENEVNGQSEQAEPVMKEGKETNADELQNMTNMHGNLQSIVNKNIAEKLNKGCLVSPAKSLERYSVDEIKNMKSSLFAQLIDPRLIEFEGSNLCAIAGYGKS